MMLITSTCVSVAPLRLSTESLSHFHLHDTLGKPAFFIALPQREQLRRREVIRIAQSAARSAIPDLQPGLMLSKVSVLCVLISQ